MGNVAAVEDLQQQIARRLEDATIRLDRPDSPGGPWWIDVEHRGQTASVEFRQDKGFGVSGPRGGYGEGPDVILTDASAAADQLVALLVADRLRDDWPSVTQQIVDRVSHAIEESLEKRLAAIEENLLTQIAGIARDLRKLESQLAVSSLVRRRTKRRSHRKN